MVCNVTLDIILSNSVIGTPLSVVLFTPGYVSNISQTEAISSRTNRHGPLKMLEKT
jgi:hypothetical protein